MAWLGVADGPLIAIRALHFAASAMTTGAVVFGAVVGKPALGSEQPLAKLQGKLTLGLASVGLAITVFSGAIWFVVQAAAMSGEPLDESLTSRVLLPVLNQTQFGQVCEVRIILALVLAACLAYRHFALANELSLAASLGLIAAIAWAGHAGSTPDELGGLHLAADALHLVAAAVWIGGLVPLVLLLGAARRERNGAGLVLAHALTRRFSVLAIASVAALLGTGFVNAWILVGSLHALLVTEYGRLLMLKLAVFAIMLLIAAVNRFWLTPRLDPASGYRSPIGALGQLTRTGSIEIALGLAIFAIVGMLGTLHPAIHFLNSLQGNQKMQMKPAAFHFFCRAFVLAIVSYVAAAPALAEEVKAGDLVISQAWSRATPGGAKIGGGYLTIENKGSTPDRLLGGSADVADRVQIHEMAMNNGVMTMRPLEKGVAIEPGKTVMLAPGGSHLMLLDLKSPLKQGDRLPVTLEFEKAGKVKVLLDVQGIGAQRPAAEGGGMPMKKMPEHSGMKM